MHPKVDDYLSKATSWNKEMTQLRLIMLDTPLTEEFKWGQPCYCFEGSNLVVIQGFKAYCALLFFKGYLLKDTENVLIKTGEHSRLGKQIRFANVKEVKAMKQVIRSYVHEAIEIEKSGVKQKPEAVPGPEITSELKKKFKEDPSFKTAFKALTPGRQRAYLIHFSSAKQAATRESRIEKSVKAIMAGKGLNE